MIAIIDYGAGNTGSVRNALERLNQKVIITDDSDQIKNADHVIFPGVGEASKAMLKLEEKQLVDVIQLLTQPVLGICLGMQLMCNASEEGNTLGLGLFECQIQRFPPKDLVPHMGWNEVMHDGDGLFKGITNSANFYFVHSYRANICNETIGQTSYIDSWSSALQKDNFYGVQFHPEKSGDVGEKLIKNFLEL